MLATVFTWSVVLATASPSGMPRGAQTGPTVSHQRASEKRKIGKPRTSRRPSHEPGADRKPSAADPSMGVAYSQMDAMLAELGRDDFSDAMRAELSRDPHDERSHFETGNHLGEMDARMAALSVDLNQNPMDFSFALNTRPVVPQSWEQCHDRATRVLYMQESRAQNQARKQATAATDAHLMQTIRAQEDAEYTHGGHLPSDHAHAVLLDVKTALDARDLWSIRSEVGGMPPIPLEILAKHKKAAYVVNQANEEGEVPTFPHALFPPLGRPDSLALLNNEASMFMDATTQFGHPHHLVRQPQCRDCGVQAAVEQQEDPTEQGLPRSSTGNAIQSLPAAGGDWGRWHVAASNNWLSLSRSASARAGGHVPKAVMRTLPVASPQHRDNDESHVLRKTSGETTPIAMQVHGAWEDFTGNL
jgi:hypothetical protein